MSSERQRLEDNRPNKPACGLCGDIGWVTGPIVPGVASPTYPCICQRDIRFTFDTFQVRPHTEVALRACHDFLDGKLTWLLLIGGFGSGKTHLLKAVADVLTYKTRQPHTRVFVPEFLNLVKAGFDNGSAEERITEVKLTPCLLMDDLGAHKPTEWSTELLTRIIDYRYENRLPSIFTSNLGEQGLMELLGPRITDRLFDRLLGQVALLTVPSFRTGKDY